LPQKKEERENARRRTTVNRAAVRKRGKVNRAPPRKKEKKKKGPRASGQGRGEEKNRWVGSVQKKPKISAKRGKKISSAVEKVKKKKKRRGKG